MTLRWITYVEIEKRKKKIAHQHFLKKKFRYSGFLPKQEPESETDCKEK